MLFRLLALAQANRNLPEEQTPQGGLS